MLSSNIKVNKKSSFAYFVYPFLFETQKFEARVKAIESAQLAGRKQSINLWEKQNFCEDDLLAHVANYLNSTGSNPATARLWKLNEALRDAFGLRANWYLESPQGKTPFVFGKEGQGTVAVQLAMFRVGVGFLTVQAKPNTGFLTDWLDFLHNFRFVQGQRGVKVLANRRTGLDPQTQQPQFSCFFPDVVGGIAKHPDGRGEFNDFIEVLLNTGAITEDLQHWWSEVFVAGQMLPFAALFVEELSPDEYPYLLYKLHNFFHSNQGNNPAPEDLQAHNPAFLPYAKQQWFMFSLEGGVFLGGDSPNTEFFRNTLPVHLSNEYFLLFLLALHQRFTLMMLLDKIAKNWIVDENNSSNLVREKILEDIHNQSLLFTARGYFTQAMQREHHHRCYRKWQDTFQVKQLYQEVNNEIQEMHEYVQIRQNQQLERTIQVIGVAVGAGGIAASSLSAYIQQPITLKPTGNIHPGVLAGALSIAIAVIAGTFSWWFLDWLKGYHRKM